MYRTAALLVATLVLGSGFIAFSGDRVGPPRKLVSQIPRLLTTGTVNVPVKNIGSLLNLLPNGNPANVGKLNASAATNLRLIAVGGAIASGYRNGGLYREGQLTAYPNLVAKQLGITDFQSPLFSENQGNGSGYSMLTTNGDYKQVANNLAVTGNDPLMFSPVSGRIDNLSFPMLGVHSSHASEEWRTDDRLTPGVPYDPTWRAYFKRLLPANEQLTARYIPYVLSQKTDLMTIDLGFDDAIWYATAGGYRLLGMMNQLAMGEGSVIIQLLAHMKKNGIRGAIATVPDVLPFPYFRFYTVGQARQRYKTTTLYVVDDDHYELTNGDLQFVTQLNDNDLLLPTEEVVALVKQDNTSKGLSTKTPLSSQSVLTAKEIKALSHVEELNSLIRYQAKAVGIPVVDIAGLHKQILSGQYVTHDGVQIDPSFPKGNFFSADGLHPTALGQAVIANEWIKTLNAHYEASIPLLSTRHFSELIKN